MALGKRRGLREIFEVRIRLVTVWLCIVTGLWLYAASAADAKKADKSAGGNSRSEVLYTDSIAAVVGDEVITVSDIVAETRPIEESMLKKHEGSEEEIRRKITELRTRTADRLVERELLFLEFKTLGGQIPREVVQDRINQIISQKAGGDRDRFEKTLSAAGMTMDEFEEKVRKDIAVEAIIQEKVRRPVRIPPSVVREYYEKHRNEFVLPRKVRLQMILLKNDGKWKGRVQEVLDHIQDALRRGKPFGKLAQKYSDHPTASSGGDLGWVKEGQLRADFAKAIKGLAPGQVSQPLKTSDGVVLLFVAETQGGGPVPFTPELQRRIERRLRAQEEERRYRELIAELERKYFVRRYYQSGPTGPK